MRTVLTTRVGKTRLSLNARDVQKPHAWGRFVQSGVDEEPGMRELLIVFLGETSFFDLERPWTQTKIADDIERAT